MQNKKTIALIFAFLVILSVCVYFVFFKARLFIQTTQTPAPEVQTIVVETKTISEDVSPLKITVDYPYIAGQEEFNNLAKNLVDKEISDFKTNALENDQAVKKIDPESYAKYPREYDLIISYEKGQVDSDLASVVFEIYKFEGGAHGSSYETALNYDFKNKKEITLGDVFAGQENYLQTISDYCIKDLTNQITAAAGNTDGTWITEGAGPVAENFKIFLINKDSIIFYFPQYQVGYGSLGGFKVAMPR